MSRFDEVPPEWRDADDSLEDVGAERLPAESRQWVAQQRFLHGLLRATNSADAAGREARVQAILERIDAERRAVPKATSERRSRWLFVVAATLFAALGTWFVLPAQLPTAEAAVQRAVANLARDVDLRYRLELTAESPDGSERLHQRFDLMTRPGMKVRMAGTLTFGAFALGEFELGCDGEEFWIRSANGMLRRSAPIAQQHALAPGLVDMLDLGYLDVHELVRRLPEDFEVAVVGVETDAEGRRLLRLEAARERAGRKPLLRRAQLWCDEATGMVTKLEVDSALPNGATRSLRFAFVGEADSGIDYRRPW